MYLLGSIPGRYSGHLWVKQIMVRSSTQAPIPKELRPTRRHQIALAGEGVLVGIAVGVLISLYRMSLSHAERALRSITEFLLSGGALALLWFFALAIILVAVGRLMLWEPSTQGSGIPQIDAEVAGRADMPWHRIIPIKFIEGVLCAFAGLSLGREGPSVQLGGMAGKGVSKALRRDRANERLLVTCGAAAGMSAAFHAPLTGVLFAVEEIHKEFSSSLIISVMCSSVVADFVTSAVLGIEPVVQFISYSPMPHELYHAVLPMGVVCGVLGVLHNKGMFFIQEQLYDRIQFGAPYTRLVIPFAIAGVVAFVYPEIMCGGDAILEHVLESPYGAMFPLFGLLVAKYVFTCVCFGSGAPGGTLFPLVVMGALIGALYGNGVSALFGVSGSFENAFIILGVAGLFASVIQAPVTAVVLVFELTGSLNALLDTSIISVISFITASLLRGEPFYEHLYLRLLGWRVEEDADEESSGSKVLKSYVIGVNSALDGHKVSEVAWPKGTLIIVAKRAGQELVVDGNTQFEALDTIVVIMDVAQEDTHVELIHALCKANL